MKNETKVRKKLIEFYSFSFLSHFLSKHRSSADKKKFFLFPATVDSFFNIEICEIIMKKKWKSDLNHRHYTLLGNMD